MAVFGSLDARELVTAASAGGRGSRRLMYNANHAIDRHCLSAQPRETLPMMFIRKLSRSLKSQNWTETWIEFVLLIIGVFLGIQVSNWNQDRIDARAEAVMLERLEEDFRAIEPQLLKTIQRYRQTVASTGEVVRQLRLPDPPQDDAAFRKILGNAAYLWTVPPISVVHTELNASGGISGLSNPELRAALMRYGAAYTVYTQIQSQAKAIFNDTQSPYHNATEWNLDPDQWQSDDAILRYDWPKLREARGELQVWLGFQYEITQVAENQLRELQAVVAVLEAD